MQKRFISWAAVSSLPQAEKISLTEQREVNLQVIAHHGGKLVADLIVDESRDIPELSEACERIEAYRVLRDMIKSGACDVIVCYTRSRLGRVAAMVETIAELCRRANVTIYETDTPPPNLEAGRGDGELLSGMVRSWKAQSEVDELRRRHKMGMLGKLKKGVFLSGVPWGWKTVLDERGKPEIVVDLDAARTIRLALVDLYLGQGMGSRYIAAELNRRGWLTSTGRPWAHESLIILFRMMWRYAGWGEINRASKGRPYARAKGNWPAILTEEELYAILDERASRVGARGRNANVYRLSLIVHCAVCQRRMRMLRSRQKVKLVNGGVNVHDYINAYCEGEPHPQRAIPVTRIIKKIRAFFVHLQDRANWTPHLVSSEVDISSIDHEMSVIEKEVRKAEQAILDADDKLIDGTFDDARHAHQVKRLKAKLVSLQGDITALADRRLVIEHSSQRVSRLEEIAAHGLDYLDMADEREANAKLRRLIKVEVEGGQVVSITLV